MKEIWRMKKWVWAAALLALALFMYLSIIWKMS